MAPEDQVSYFARTTARRELKLFGIRQRDRLMHTLVVGQTGAGKSALLETLARQDIAAGRGVAVIDPHGDLVARLKPAIPEKQRDRLVYFDATDPASPSGYNPLRRVRDDKIPLAASGLLDTMRNLWPDAWGVRMEHVLRNSLYALLERDGSTLPDVLRLYLEPRFRAEVRAGIRNEVVRRFWTSEFENYPERYQTEIVMPIMNKLGAMLSDPLLYRTLVTPKVDVRVRALMDRGHILLVNLAKGVIGEDSATTLGGLLISTIGLAALSRAEEPAAERRPFHVFVDEFQSFTTRAFVGMSAELRKFGVSLTLATQTTTLLETDIRHAVLANAGTLIAFRLGAEDAALLAPEFEPVFGPTDLMSLPNRHCYLRLMIDGPPTRPFSAETIALEELPHAA